MTVSPDPKYQGRGEIRRDQLLAKVQYNLYEREYPGHTTRELGTRRPRKQSEKRVRGTIVVVEGDEDLTKYIGRLVTLHRADNSPVSIFIERRTKRNPPTYEVEVSE